MNENIKNLENYKTELCKYYMSPKGCNKSKEKCSYAHGEDDLRKKWCKHYEKCWNKYCEYDHPPNWNYKDNIKTCNYYKNGFCRNDNYCNFKHIIGDIKEDNVKVDEKIYKDLDINNYNEFPFLKEDTNFNIVKEENNNNENDQNKTVIFENFNHDNKKDNIFEDNKIKIKDLSNVEIFVNGVEYNNTDNIINISDEKNNKVIENNNEFHVLKEKEDNATEDVEELILNLQKCFEKYNNEIKHSIDNLFVEDKQIYGINMKLELNKIMSEISLLKNNYRDFINIINF